MCKQSEIHPKVWSGYLDGRDLFESTGIARRIVPNAVGWEGVGWIHMTDYKIEVWVLVNSYKASISIQTENSLNS
jgi:hypothetical protein